MAYYQISDPDELIPCPYNSSEMIPYRRMQYHLIKCQKNFPGKKYAICPFNARHHVPKSKLNEHMVNCPDKVALEHLISYEQSKMSEDGKNFKGCTDLPKYDDTCNSTGHSENWDEEISDSPRIGVDPAYFDRMDYKDLTGMNRCEKREWKKQFYLAPEERQHPMHEAKEEDKGELRKPHVNPSNLMQAQQQHSQVLNYSLAMAGIGRGGAGLSSHVLQGLDHEIRQVGNVATMGRGIGRANVSGFGGAIGLSEDLTREGKENGRTATMQNYKGNKSVNGSLLNGTPQTGMDFSHGNGATDLPPGLSVSEGPEGLSNAAISLDAKNKEIRKIEKKLKQIELLEGKAAEGYKYNTEEEKKVNMKENLLRALEKLNKVYKNLHTLANIRI